MLAAFTHEFWNGPMGFLGALCSVASTLVALIVALASLRSRAAPDDTQAKTRDLRPILLLSLVIPICYGFGSLAGGILSANWFAGIVMAALLAMVSSAFISFIAGILLHDWMRRSVVTYKYSSGKKTIEQADLGGHEPDDFVAYLAAGIAIFAIALILACLFDPWVSAIGRVVDYARAYDEAHPRPYSSDSWSAISLFLYPASAVFAAGTSFYGFLLMTAVSKAVLQVQLHQR